jgi:murein DD-endopeptidase MepM/ murein hydrolase activator NlpD
MKQRVPTVSVLIFMMITVSLSLAVLLFQSAKARGGVILRPPFEGNYRVVSYFDHQTPNYTGDNYIWIYNGERVSSSLAAHTGEPYPYDGHDGWDWSMNTGTDILAAAAGTVVVSTGNNNWPVEPCYGRTIVIDHGNSYYTQYSHLDQILVQEGNQVTAGQHIAESGNTAAATCPVGGHLHFSVRHGGYDQDIYRYATDPFGWRSQQPDPLINHPAQGEGHTASCLWRSIDEDPISCADTIVEDDGSGFVASGDWLTSTRGNGYRMHYRRNIADTSVYANWLSTVAGTGPNKIYAFIPSQNATTHQAPYNIWTGSRWETSTVNQQNYTDTWVLLGTYQLPARYAFVFMFAQTGELTNTTWIAADAIKFRSYADFLPIVIKEPTPRPTRCNDC